MRLLGVLLPFVSVLFAGGAIAAPKETSDRAGGAHLRGWPAPHPARRKPIARAAAAAPRQGYRRPALGSWSLQREIDSLCVSRKPRSTRLHLAAVLRKPTAIALNAKLAIGQILLSFDDGPRLPHSAILLDMLRRCGIRAHFFLMGCKARKPRYRKVIGDMSRLGHQVGSHGMWHRNLKRAEKPAIRREILDGHRRVEAALGARTPFVRLPFGAGHFRRAVHAVLAERQLVSMFWSLSIYDAKRQRPEQLLASIMRIVDDRRRGVLTLHAGNYWTLKTVPRLLKKLIRKRYQFVTVTPPARTPSGQTR